MLPRRQDIVADKPIAGNDLIEPREPWLTGVAAIAAVAGPAGIPGRTHCNAASTTIAATASLPNFAIQLSLRPSAFEAIRSH